MGYALKAHIWKRNFWTISVWEDEAHLRQFAFDGLHRSVISVLRDDLGHKQSFSSLTVQWLLTATTGRSLRIKRNTRRFQRARLGSFGASDSLLFNQNTLFRALNMNTENDSSCTVRTTAWRVYGPWWNHIGVAGLEYLVRFALLDMYGGAL